MAVQTVIAPPDTNGTIQAGVVVQETKHFLPPKPPESVHKSYAGFWIRAEAFLNDFVFLYAIVLVSTLVLVLCLAYLTNITLSGIAMVVFVFFHLYGLIGVWLYFALFESSRKQATPGKLLLCLKVVDVDGSKLSFGRATARYFAKFLSCSTLGVGCFMAGFTLKKQTLHDMIAKCFVVRK
jgi:uncharacterized RDD family membrane protein YckC